MQVSSASISAATRTIVSALRAKDRAEMKASDAIKVAMQQFVDMWFLSTADRTKASCDDMYDAIMKSRAVLDYCGDDSKKLQTFRNYAGGAKRALHFNVDWHSKLHQDSAFIPPWSKKTPAAEKATGTKGSKTDPVKAGKVTTTTRAEADKTLSKAFAQYRMIGMNEFVANMLDLALESLEGFKETVLDK